jgi:hypothetical protein
MKQFIVCLIVLAGVPMAVLGSVGSSCIPWLLPRRRDDVAGVRDRGEP